MHVIFVTSEIPTKDNYGGGLATFTANIAEIFAKKGNQVEILYVTTKDQHVEYDCSVEVKNIFIKMSDWEVYDNVSRIYHKEKENADVNRREILYIMKAREVCDEIKRINKENKVDIVHFCNHGSFSMLMDDSIPYCIRISGFLNILHGGASTANGSLEYKDNPLSIGDQLEQYCLMKAKYVFTPSRLLAEIGHNNLGIDIDVLESPYIKDFSQWDYSLYNNFDLEKKRYLLFYGNLRYLKGIQVIADIIKRILMFYPDVYLLLAGVDMDVKNDHGEIIKASNYVKERAGDYSDRVIYLGKLRRSELYPIISRAETCILPSRIENLSNACIESMSMGKIVIGTRGASFEQLIEDGKNGFLGERDNADSFYKCVEKVLSLSNEERSEIERNAKDTVKRLEPDVIYENFKQYYQRVIANFANKI